MGVEVARRPMKSRLRSKIIRIVHWLQASVGRLVILRGTPVVNSAEEFSCLAYVFTCGSLLSFVNNAVTSFSSRSLKSLQVDQACPANSLRHKL